MAAILSIQILAFAYGVWSVYIARPAYLVHEKDLFRVVRWVDIPEQKLPLVAEAFHPTLWKGPVPLGLRDFSSDRERLNTMLAEINGLPISAMPEFWLSYTDVRDQVLQRALPVSQLLQAKPWLQQNIDSLEMKSNLKAQRMGYFPLVHGTITWTIVVSLDDAEVVGILPADPGT